MLYEVITLILKDFFQLSLVHCPFEGAEVVDEQGAEEMIHFVLDDAGKAVFRIECQGIALHILGRDMDFLKARDLVVAFDHAQTALFLHYRVV